MFFLFFNFIVLFLTFYLTLMLPLKSVAVRKTDILNTTKFTAVTFFCWSKNFGDNISVTMRENTRLNLTFVVAYCSQSSCHIFFFNILTALDFVSNKFQLMNIVCKFVVDCIFKEKAHQNSMSNEHPFGEQNHPIKRTSINSLNINLQLLVQRCAATLTPLSFQQTF